METTTLALLVLIPLLVWRAYARVKRLMGRQLSQLWRHWAGSVLFPLAIAGGALATQGHVLALSCLGAGALAGVWLGLWNIKLSRFEQQGALYFYTPNFYLGMTVTMLFVARLLYRALELYINSRAAMPELMQGFAQSPLSTLSFGLLTGYYSAYSWGLLRWRRSLA